MSTLWYLASGIPKEAQKALKRRLDQELKPDDRLLAATLGARVTAEALGLPFETAHDLAWKIEKPLLFKEARRWALEMTQKSNLFLPIAGFKNYPIWPMHYTKLALRFYELLQARAFVCAVTERYRPEKIVVIGDGIKSSQLPLIDFLSRSNGLEKEIIPEFCQNHDLEYEQIVPERSHLELPRVESWFFKQQHRVLNKIGKMLGYISAERRQETLSSVPDPIAQDPVFHVKQASGKRVLIFSWGSYYLEQIVKSIRMLRLSGHQVTIVYDDQPSGARIRQLLTPMEVQSYWRQEFDSPVSEAFLSYQDTLKNFRQSLDGSQIARSIECDFPCTLRSCVDAELAAMENTAKALEQNENILDQVRPNVVFAHFAMHANETVDVLPARKQGIPTCSMIHGIWDQLGTEWDAFATEYYGVWGDGALQARREVFGESTSKKIRVIGDQRIEDRGKTGDRLGTRLRYGLNAKGPVVIFCDTAGWNHTEEWRHSSLPLLDEVLSAVGSNRRIQPIFRLHPGVPDSDLRAFLSSRKAGKRVLLQDPTLIPLVDILPAADVVIAGLTTGILEALACGVPVIYFCPHGEREPTLYGHETIWIADKPGMLKTHLAKILKLDLRPQWVREHSQSVFDDKLDGMKGNAAEKLSALIEEALLSRPAGNCDDWLERMRKSASWDGRTWRNYLPT